MLHQCSHPNVVQYETGFMCILQIVMVYLWVWDFSSHLNALAESEKELSHGPSPQAPLFKFGHKDEGFTLDWSPLVTGRLVSGDCKSYIHLWEPTFDGTCKVGTTPYMGHTASLEDSQWSPTEPDVFASCSVDGNIAIWDIRLENPLAVWFKAHDVDVNVISWNRVCVWTSILLFLLAIWGFKKVRYVEFDLSKRWSPIQVEEMAQTFRQRISPPSELLWITVRLVKLWMEDELEETEIEGFSSEEHTFF